VEAAHHHCIDEEEQLHHIEADQVALAPEEIDMQLNNERRTCVRLVANQMTQASTTQYIPCEKQVLCVTVKCYTLQEALTIGGITIPHVENVIMVIQMNVSGF